jgi:hypothetical protein
MRVRGAVVQCQLDFDLLILHSTSRFKQLIEPGAWFVLHQLWMARRPWAT